MQVWVVVVVDACELLPELVDREDLGSLSGVRRPRLNRPGFGVYCYAPDGTPIGRIALPEHTSSLTFGGAKRNRLFVTASRSLYSIMLTVEG